MNFSRYTCSNIRMSQMATLFFFYLTEWHGLNFLKRCLLAAVVFKLTMYICKITNVLFFFCIVTKVFFNEQARKAKAG